MADGDGKSTKADRKRAKRARRRARRERLAKLGGRPKFYQSMEWKQARYKALKLCGGRCQACGRGPMEGAVLNVDHIKPLSRHPELALDLSNLQVLCGACNAGKGAWDTTDWREPSLRVLMGEAAA